MSRADSRVPESWGKTPNFAFINREAFKEMAADDVFPRWLRVTFAGYAHVASNGHALFRQKRLAQILGDQINGVWIPTSRQRVREAIDGAIERKLLMPESRALCLVLPAEVIAYGVGKPESCPRHEPQKERQKRVVSGQNDRDSSFLSDPKERQNRVVSGSAPLFSLPTPTPDDRKAS